MQAQVLTGWTLRQLIIELADAVSLATLGTGADNRATVPSDPNTLDQLTRAINRGYKSFLAANPRWTFLERPVQITLSTDGSAAESIDSDPGRYLLPSYVTGNPKGDWSFVDDNADRTCIITTSEHIVRRYRDGSPDTSGTPLYGCVRPLNPPKGGSLRAARQELVIYPDPDEAYVIEAVFRITAHELVELEDRHIAGAEHDMAILEQAVWQWRQLETPGLPQPTTELAKSILLDRATTPVRPGAFANTFQTERGEKRLPERRDIYVNDQPL